MPASTTLRVSVAVLGILAVVVVAYLATAVSVFQHDVDVAITSTPPEPLTPGYLPIYAAFGDSLDAAAFTAEPATQSSYYQNFLVAPTCSVNPDEIYAVAAPTSVEVVAIDLEGGHQLDGERDPPSPSTSCPTWYGAATTGRTARWSLASASA